MYKLQAFLQLQLRNDSLKGHGPSSNSHFHAKHMDAETTCSCIFSFIFIYKIYDMSMICPIPGTQSLAVGA